MAESDKDAIWDKLDSIEKRGTETLLEMARLGGDQRTAHAEFNGKLSLMGQKLEGLERAQAHDKNNAELKFSGLDVRLGGLEGKHQFLLGKVAGVSAAISTLIALAAMAVKILNGG